MGSLLSRMAQSAAHRVGRLNKYFKPEDEFDVFEDTSSDHSVSREGYQCNCHQRYTSQNPNGDKTRKEASPACAKNTRLSAFDRRPTQSEVTTDENLADEVIPRAVLLYENESWKLSEPEYCKQLCKSRSSRPSKPGESTQSSEDLRIKLPPRRSIKLRNTSFGGKSEVVKYAVVQYVGERATHGQLPTFTAFTLLEKNDFLKSFESMLEQAKAQNIDVVGKIFHIANFAAAILDCHGGCLSIDDLDVHLYVPPGAIPEEQTQQVYIYVTGTSSVESHYFSTPFIHCGPPDTVFNKDVVLTMPHCVKDTSSCKFSLSKLSSGGSSELREGSDVIMVVDNDSITFSINRFCRIRATASPVDGTILEKTMIACLFIHEDSHFEDEITLRLRLVDDVKVNVQEVKTEERRHRFYSADMDSPLIVRKNDQDVVANISTCSESWEISEPESCQLKFNSEFIWPETAAVGAQGFPSGLIFAKRHRSPQKVPFKARMTVYQEDGSGSCNGVDFLVDATQRPTRGDHSFASSLRYTAAETSIVSRLTAKLGEQVLESNEEQTQTAKRSVEQRKTSLDVNSEVSQSVEESTTYSQPPTLTDFTLIEKKDFLKSFESMLEQAKAQSIDVVGKVFQIANFAAAILDCQGGCLSIDNLDVHLYVPPGAIPEEQTQQVYIYVTGTSSVESHYYSTPFVHCGPPDTVFDKDVVLTMPHCVKDTSSCKFSLSKLSSGGSSELSEGSDVITVVDNDSITFSVNHFCGFGATASPVDGTILEKTMIACLFIHEDSHSEDVVTLRLRLVDDVKVNVLEVKTEERKHGFYSADVDSPLIVQNNNQDVVARISNCNSSWELSEPESGQRNIHRMLLWRETEALRARAFPSAVFVAERRSGSRKVCFTAHMTVLQEGSGVYGANFSVDANKERIQQPALDRETQIDRIKQMFLEQMAKLQCTSVRPRLLEESIFNKLCDLFDDPNPLGNDWRKLATLLLNRSVSIGSISDKAGRERRSPTEIVFELFVGRQSGRTEEETRATLTGALIDMNRPDAEFAIVAIREY